MSSTDAPLTRTDSLSSCLVKDTDYYFEDGDCIIRAENSLFRIHKFLFKRDSAFFKTLFSLPQPSSKPGLALKTAGSSGYGEGESEDNPMICQDTAEDFRSLCWVLYARPSDIDAQQDPATTDLARLARLVAISHKYEFEALNDWSWKKIDDQSARVSDQLLSRLGNSWKELERLLNLSVQLQKATLAGRIEEAWLREIQSSDIARSREAFEAALEAAERFPAHRQFHGRVYHTFLKAFGAYNSLASIKAGDPGMYVNLASSDFSEERTRRLCSGFWSLSHLRLRLSIPPQVDDNPSCANHATQCVGVWKRWWYEQLRSLQSPVPQDPRDLLQRIQTMVTSDSAICTITQHYNTWNHTTTQTTVVAPCSSGMVQQLRSMTKIFDDTLPDHFMIPPE